MATCQPMATCRQNSNCYFELLGLSKTLAAGTTIAIVLRSALTACPYASCVGGRVSPNAAGTGRSGILLTVNPLSVPSRALTG